LQGEITTYRSRLTEAERERGKAASLEEELRKLHKEFNALSDENRQLHEKWKEKARQAGILRDEKSDLKQSLQQTLNDNQQLKEQTQRLKDLEVERKQSAIKLESMYRQVASLEHYKEESARLNTLIAEVPHLHSSMDQLKRENRELRSLGLVYQPPSATMFSMAPITTAQAGSEANVHCFGVNKCKGHGFVSMSKHACEEIGGSVDKPRGS